MDRLLGTWDVVVKHVAVAEPVQGRHRYERVLDGAYVLLHCTYAHPDFPDAMSLLDDTTCHYFDVRGVTRRFDLQVDDDGWSMVRRDPDFWQRTTVRFFGADAMTGTGENSHDAGRTWELDVDLAYTRA